MNCSMQDYLKIVTPHLHPDLVSAAALSHIQPLAHILPAASLGGFECRLGEHRSAVDFHTLLPCLDRGLPESFLVDPAWQFLQDFYRHWASPNSSLRRDIEKIGLEFDISDRLPQVPIPCIFWEFSEEMVINTQNLLKTIAQLQQPISPLLESHLQLCVDSLPPGASIRHLGAMLSRSVKAIRVNVMGISPEQLSDYLRQIGWSDPTNTLPQLTSTLSNLGDIATLSFDIGDAVLPRIGLHCLVKNHLDRDRPALASDWELFLDYLVAEKLCTPAKKNALLNWSGISHRLSDPDLWPGNISFGDRFLGYRAVSLFSRWLNHIKLVYQPGIPLEAKGYLGFGHLWFAPNLSIKTEPQKTETSNSIN